MYGMNIELTTCCPLHCPQCYCTLEGGKHIPLDVAKKRIAEGAAHGVKLLHLSGGETMCYPHLYEIVAYAAQAGIQVNVALSGWHFDQTALDRLIAAGVNGIFISLNGSTAEINSLTRDGFEYSIHALQLLKDAGYKNTYVNWVMHSNNCEDFDQVIQLVESYQVAHFVVLSFKPDSSHQLSSFPTGQQIVDLSEKIKKYRGPVQIMVESCFSQLLAVMKDTRLFGNLNVGPMKGCRAALYNYSINVDGDYSPCRHLDYIEKFDSLDEYLANSKIVEKIKHVEDTKRQPCSNCYYKENCKPCLAVSSKLHNELYIGHEICELWKTQSR